MHKMSIEITGDLEIKLEGEGGVLGTLFLSTTGLGFKAPNARGGCTKQLPFTKMSPMIDAIGDPIADVPNMPDEARMDGHNA